MQSWCTKFYVHTYNSLLDVPQQLGGLLDSKLLLPLHLIIEGMSYSVQPFGEALVKRYQKTTGESWHICNTKELVNLQGKPEVSTLAKPEPDSWPRNNTFYLPFHTVRVLLLRSHGDVPRWGMQSTYLWTKIYMGYFVCWLWEIEVVYSEYQPITLVDQNPNHWVFLSLINWVLHWAGTAIWWPCSSLCQSQVCRQLGSRDA